MQLSNLKITLLLLFFGTMCLPSIAQQNVQDQTGARRWMDVILRGIEQDPLGPTIHARNLYHASIMMYDAWAIYDDKAETIFLGKTLQGFSCPLDEFGIPEGANVDSLSTIVMNYALYRCLDARWRNWGSKTRVVEHFEELFIELGGVESNRSIDYQGGDAVALGNYLGMKLRDYALQDGSDEDGNFEDKQYFPVNPHLYPNRPGAQNIRDVNRWQPLSNREYIQLKGGDPTLVDWNYSSITQIDVFLTPEWGLVSPFALLPEDRTEGVRDDFEAPMWLDPGTPPLLDYDTDSLLSEQYKWGFILVALWGAHMDPNDGGTVDISPGAQGSVGWLPESYEDYGKYYDFENGGTVQKGHKVNPATGKPYEKNVVPLGDYVRVIAEYWVDGINTASPPGHWIRNLNNVSDYPGYEHKWAGKGKVLDRLEWDVKTYLALCGALHDAGIAAWSVKGHYDYVRPISAIRLMGEFGQCTDPKKPHYHRNGLPLVENHIELVTKKDPLAGENGEHVNKIKIMSWRGPDYIEDARKDIAGVGWILAENWWPYQRYAFATPPFAGYVSGHSTFSLAAAEMLTMMTGDPYFPGGMSQWTAKKDDFLLFEAGPTQDITLQWATYVDAAEETCLSRIWGGIHPPCDDIQARIMGQKVAARAFKHAATFFK
jgi:hypothetical protein